MFRYSTNSSYFIACGREAKISPGFESMARRGGEDFPFLRSSSMILLILAASSFTSQALPHRSNHTERELSWLRNRPPEASYMLPRRNRDLGMLYMGAMERSRLIVHKMMTGGEQ